MEAIIDIDAREDHPTIIFFTDRATGYTVAAEKATGTVIGCSAPRCYDLYSLDALWAAVRRYELAMMEGKTCDEYYKRG